ncbi:MAG: transcriptional repressor [Spirochaetes bacterium]|nr:MAG: transcriptional repressor [Spirochaetota bacterium]
MTNTDKKSVDMKSLQEHLIKNGINPSFQRLKILEYLMNNDTHPTVDNIYNALIDIIPTISKTTIYNTLKLFVEKKLAQTITIDENEVRYDGNVEPHAHFKCIKCGRIYDIKIDSSNFDYNQIDGHKVLECHIYLKGVCKNCLK